MPLIFFQALAHTSNWDEGPRKILRVIGRRGGHRGVGDESPVLTSYRLPIATTGLSRTVFALLRRVTDRRTDRWNWSSKRQHYALKCSSRQKTMDTFTHYWLGDGPCKTTEVS